MKRFISFIFVVILFFASLTCFVNLPNIVFANNNITEIKTLADFYAIKNNRFGNYVLTCDLDFSYEGTTFKPFEFRGTFDGNYHSLKNLNLITEAEFAGLFSKLNCATIKNLTLDNFQIYGLDSGVGGALAGEIYNSNIANLNILFDENNFVYGGKAGLIASKIESSTIDNVFVLGGIVNGIKTQKLADEIVKTNVVLSDRLITVDKDLNTEQPDTSGDNNKDDDKTPPDNKDDNKTDPELPEKPTDQPENKPNDVDNKDNNNENTNNSNNNETGENNKPPVDNNNDNNSANGAADSASNNKNKTAIILLSTLIPLGCVLCAGSVFVFIKFKKRK